MKATRLAVPLTTLTIVLGGLWLTACNSPGGRHTAPGAAAAPGPERAAAQAGPQRLELRGPSGEALVTIQLQGTERRVELAGGKGTLVGRQKPKDPQKTLYEGAARYEIKEGDAGFKLRDGDGKLLWKVKLHPEKVKLSDNEEGEHAFELVPRDGGRIKLKRDEKELGKAECREGKVKIEDEAGQGRGSVHGDASGRCSGAGTLLLIEQIPADQRAILMAEIWARGR